MATRKKASSTPMETKTNKTAAKNDDTIVTERKDCFVMMPFVHPFSVYYTHIIQPAIAEAGMNSRRADDLFRPSIIISDIWKFIRESQILIAEMTTKNANVFYELGLAHAIGKPVILISETMDDVPFDLQQLRVLLYDKNDPQWGDKLRISLIKAINEVNDNPFESIPPTFRITVKSMAPEQDEILTRIETLEGRVRLLSLETRRRTYQRPWLTELNEVDNPAALEEWVRKWAGNVPTKSLIQAMQDSPRIPDREIQRLFPTQMTFDDLRPK